MWTASYKHVWNDAPSIEVHKIHVLIFPAQNRILKKSTFCIQPHKEKCNHGTDKYKSLNGSNIKAQIKIIIIAINDIMTILLLIIAINDPEEMPASVIVRVAGLSDCLLTLILLETSRPDKTPFAAKIFPQIVKIFLCHCQKYFCWYGQGRLRLNKTTLLQKNPKIVKNISLSGWKKILLTLIMSWLLKW